MTARADLPKPPKGSKAAGRALWESVLGPLELDQHEVQILTDAARTADLIDALQEQIDRLGPLVDSPQGIKANPAVVEVRQQRLVLARLLSALRLPTGIADAAAKATGARGRGGVDLTRPQRRAGARGFYAVDGGVS